MSNDWTTHGEIMLNLCKAVVEAAKRDADMHQGAEMLLIASIYNTRSNEIFETCHGFAVKVGYDFSKGTEA